MWHNPNPCIAPPVDQQKLAETVLLTLECFFALQELEQDHKLIMDGLYSSRPVTYSEVAPLLRVNTTLSMLTVPLCFADRLARDKKLTLTLDPHRHGIILKKDSVEIPVKGEISSVLRCIRNAVAHLPDFIWTGADSADASIRFDESATLFVSEKTKKSKHKWEVVFSNSDGFADFLRDLLPAIRNATRMLLQMNA